MNAERTIHEQHDLDAEMAADARAEADIEAVRVIDHEDVVTWLATWGTPDEKPLAPDR
jgi:predicted transcriptional regulator